MQVKGNGGKESSWGGPVTLSTSARGSIHTLGTFYGRHVNLWHTSMEQEESEDGDGRKMAVWYL